MKPKSEIPFNVQMRNNLLSFILPIVHSCVVYDSSDSFFNIPAHAASGIEGVDVLAADVADQYSLESMCAKATVIINCVGPVSQVYT